MTPSSPAASSLLLVALDPVVEGKNPRYPRCHVVVEGLSLAAAVLVDHVEAGIERRLHALPFVFAYHFCFLCLKQVGNAQHGAEQYGLGNDGFGCDAGTHAHFGSQRTDILHIGAGEVGIDAPCALAAVGFPSKVHVNSAPYQSGSDSRAHFQLPVPGEQLTLEVDVRRLAVEGAYLDGKLAVLQHGLGLAVACH